MSPKSVNRRQLTADGIWPSIAPGCVVRFRMRFGPEPVGSGPKAGVLER
jgi:hypothetical protein